jgi:dolichyl-phosphate beta-glucosyltransferase
VDDGSPAPDRTKEIVQADYVNKRGSNQVRLLTLGRNHGKGGAVRKGVLRARGRYVLFADADGATAASDLARLLSSVRAIEKGGLGIAVGSRAAAEEAEGGPKAKRTVFRKILGWGFRTLISLLVGGHSIRDTQCGFKLFTRRYVCACGGVGGRAAAIVSAPLVRPSSFPAFHHPSFLSSPQFNRRSAAARVFPIQHIERWAFDVELLFLAAKFGVPMVEVPVTWNEIDGSTLSPAQAAIQMLRDVVKIWLAYLTGIWSYSK